MSSIPLPWSIFGPRPFRPVAARPYPRAVITTAAISANRDPGNGGAGRQITNLLVDLASDVQSDHEVDHAQVVQSIPISNRMFVPEETVERSLASATPSRQPRATPLRATCLRAGEALSAA